MAVGADPKLLRRIAMTIASAVLCYALLSFVYFHSWVFTRPEGKSLEIGIVQQTIVIATYFGVDFDNPRYASAKENYLIENAKSIEDLRRRVPTELSFAAYPGTSASQDAFAERFLVRFADEKLQLIRHTLPRSPFPDGIIVRLRIEYALLFASSTVIALQLVRHFRKSSRARGFDPGTKSPAGCRQCT